MPDTANKVRLTIKNAHIAPITGYAGTVPAYETPIPVPGTVNLDLAPVGELTKFYADGVVYWQGEANNGYEGDWEIALFPEELLEKIWKNEKVTTDNVYIENATVTTAAFALLFEIVGDTSARKYCLYNCTATRPNTGAGTSTENLEPQTQSSTISAVPLPDGNVRAVTAADTTEEVLQNWYKKVYLPTAGAAAAASAPAKTEGAEA